MSNTQEDALLSSWDYQQKLADGMVAEIVESYGMPFCWINQSDERVFAYKN